MKIYSWVTLHIWFRVTDVGLLYAGFCPRNCSGNGQCLHNGVCECESGYTGIDCSTGNISFEDIFFPSISFLYWSWCLQNVVYRCCLYSFTRWAYLQSHISQMTCILAFVAKICPFSINYGHVLVRRWLLCICISKFGTQWPFVPPAHFLSLLYLDANIIELIAFLCIILCFWMMCSCLWRTMQPSRRGMWWWSMWVPLLGLCWVHMPE